MKSGREFEKEKGKGKEKTTPLEEGVRGADRILPSQTLRLYTPANADEEEMLKERGKGEGKDLRGRTKKVKNRKTSRETLIRLR